MTNRSPVLENKNYKCKDLNIWVHDYSTNKFMKRLY
jgi:hypothetical protein